MNVKDFAKVLSIALIAACGGGGMGGDSPDTPRSDLPADLAGRWFTGTLSTLEYENPSTGKWKDPSGEGFYFIFGADGSYETGAVIDSFVAGCQMRLLGTEVGTVTRDGGTLTVYRHWIKTHVDNSCGNSGERTQGESTRLLTYGVEVDDQGLEWLVLTHDDGTLERYHRWTD